MQEMIYAAAAVGMWATVSGNRTAMALLLSLVISMGFGQSFEPLCLICLDLLVLRVIVLTRSSETDIHIAALMVIGWLSYAVSDPVRADLSAIVVSLQLFLTAPLEVKQWRTIKLRPA